VAALFFCGDSRFRICVNGETWDHDFSRIWYPRFSPDNQLTALACDEDAWTLIVKDTPWNHSFDYAWNTRFTRNGKHIALEFQNWGEYGMVLDDRPWPTVFHGLGHVALSEDGGHSAAVVQVAPLSEGDIFAFQDGIFTVAVNGIRWDRTFVNAWNPSFNRDGTRTAAAVRLNLYDYTVAVDGVPWSRSFDCVWEPRFHPTQGWVAAPVRTHGKWTMAGDGRFLWKNRYFQLWHAEFNRDGSSLAAIAALSFGAWSVVVNGNAWKLRPFDAITHLTFSPDGSRISAVGQKKGRQTLICDGKSGNTFYDRIWAPVFSPDGNHIAAKVDINGRYSVILNNGIWDKTFETLWDPVFDDTSETLMIRSFENGVYSKHRIPLVAF
jgi:hypothetical protein